MWQRIVDLFSAADLSALPKPVRQAVAKREQESEVLVGYLQLFLVGMLSVLYAVAPSPDNMSGFMAEPYALFLYAILTLGRIYWAQHAPIPNWALYGSILIDTALLMLLIWSFHIQYSQPAAFYLKAPTFLYVFFLIALRALRFDPRFVIAAGAAAAAGWALMVGYILLNDPTVITRDYVAYLTSNAVLIGAEIDKIIVILVVTAILALAIARGREVLIRAMAQEAATRNLSRFFDPSVAKGIAETDQPIAAGEGVERDAAIINVDIRGFSKLAATMAPDDIMALLADYQSRVIPIISSHDGVIDKFLGDGIMATFGAAKPSAAFARDAVLAATEILAQVDAWNVERSDTGQIPLEINVGVASGRVVFGAVGDASRLEYTVIGGPVNVSAKIEKHNKDEGVRGLCTKDCLSQAVAQGFQGAAPLEHRSDRIIDGIAAPLDLVVLSH